MILQREELRHRLQGAGVACLQRVCGAAIERLCGVAFWARLGCWRCVWTTFPAHLAAREMVAFCTAPCQGRHCWPCACTGLWLQLLLQCVYGPVSATACKCFSFILSAAGSILWCEMMVKGVLLTA